MFEDIWQIRQVEFFERFGFIANFTHLLWGQRHCDSFLCLSAIQDWIFADELSGKFANVEALRL
jgi:hypothetical protein